MGMFLSALGAFVFLAFASPALAASNDAKLEVRIEESGEVLVRGAKVTSVATSTIVATTAIGPTSLSWQVTTTGSTKFLRHRGGSSTLSDIAVGDTISFSGTLASTSPLSVKADSVKDWSVGEKRVTFSGNVKSVDVSNNRFVFTTKNDGDVTAQLTATTSVMKDGVNALLSVLSIGDTIRASGIFNRDTKILFAQKVMLEGKKGADGKRDGWKGFLKLWEDRVHLKLNFNR